ncbi:AAA family ATPase [Microgenomates group bacterium]|nr:AAA family ATPase [Microgenomates group bacterium]
MTDPNLSFDPIQTINREIEALKITVAQSQLPDDLKHKANREIIALQTAAGFGNYDTKYDMVTRYINWLLAVPWKSRAADNLNLAHAQEVFNRHSYGMEEIKNRFYEFIAEMNLRAKQAPDLPLRSPVIFLVGLVGTGKTTFAYALAEALGRPLIRIPFGGLASSSELRGQNRLTLDASPGKVIKGLAEAKVRNPIILLDEIDRVAVEANRDIMGVLVELLDPAQNNNFVDTYLDYPVNLSEAIFIATANNTNDIATAVLDRVEKLSMPSYSDEEKLVIAKNYLLPRLYQQTGLQPNQLVIADSVWPHIIRPLGHDMGIRTLERTLDNVFRKAIRIIVERGFNEIVVTTDNMKIFLPTY